MKTEMIYNVKNLIFHLHAAIISGSKGLRARTCACVYGICAMFEHTYSRNTYQTEEVYG